MARFKVDQTSSNTRTLAFFSITIALMLVDGIRLQAQDPLLYLRGVMSRRATLPSGTFELLGKGSISGYESGRRFSVSYSGNNALFIHDAKNSTLLKDGESFFYFDESCTIRDPGRPGVGLLFDPRVFGLTMVYQPNVDLDLALRLAIHEEVKLGPMEEINGCMCEVVDVTDHFGERKKYWIEVGNDFRVHKCEHIIKGWRCEIVSQYDDSIAKGVIPFRVVRKRYDESGGLLDQLTMKISKWTNETPSRFGLQSLGLERGTPVSDIRIKQRIGYWDGRKLQSSFIAAQPVADEAKGPKKSSNFWYWILGGFGIVGVTVTTVLLRRSNHE